MSNLPEIKERLERLNQLSSRMREQLTRFSGPEGEELKKKAKEHGTRIGVGVGVSFFGLAVATLATLYVLAVIILLVNIALDRLWLSALIVVGGFLFIGGAIIVIGAGIAHSSAKELSATTEDAKNQIKQTGEEMKAEVEALSEIARKEAAERQKQMTEMVETVKQNAAVIAPVVGVVLLILRLVARALRRRREKRSVMKIIDYVDEIYAERELPE